MHITYVKKILQNGEQCQKCADVDDKLTSSGYLRYIDKTVIADERDDSSEGMLIAQTHNVDRAPFFVVKNGDDTTIYTVYLKFVKEVLNKATNEKEELSELMDISPDLEFI